MAGHRALCRRLGCWNVFYGGVVYLFNYNDPYPSMASRLALLKGPNSRFASIDQYEGFKGQFEPFIKDRLKSLTLLMMFLESLSRRESARDQSHQAAGEKISPLQNCPNGRAAAHSSRNIETLDTFALYQAHFQEAGFYSDPGHLGRRGHAVLGEWLTQAVLTRLEPQFK